jgi:hypothetical protein
MSTRERFCWWCGASLGALADKDYEPIDTCGAQECENEASLAIADSAEEAHKALDVRIWGRQ